MVVALTVTISLPESPLGPVHPPEAKQAVVCRETHESVLVAPNIVGLGEACNESVGSGFGFAFTVTDCVEVAEPLPHESV